MMLGEVLARFNSGELLLLLFGALGVFALLVVAIVAIIAGERRRLRVAQLQIELKQELLQRGMTAEEIERVLKAGAAKANPDDEHDEDRYATVGPATCDVAVQDSGDDWQRAVLLGMRGDRCLVHYVGSDVSDNEWVGKSRVRFPASVAFAEAFRGEWPEDYNAQEATVEQDGTWYPAYVLMHLDRCYIHYIGHDWSDNEWVEESRVRFSGRPAAPVRETREARAQPTPADKPAPLELEV
jgi:hypothetical protein